MSDFTKQDEDLEKFLNNQWARELLDDVVIDLGDYSDEEIRESVVQDILMMTMWEVKFQKSMCFKLDDLVMFVSNHNRPRVLEALDHPDVVIFLDSVKKTQDQLRIRPERVVKQAAMDYCGVYYSGYDIPPDAIMVNREVLEDLVEETGGVEPLAKSLAMDLESEHIVSPKVQ
jgi:hypothetical protein